MSSRFLLIAFSALAACAGSLSSPSSSDKAVEAPRAADSLAGIEVTLTASRSTAAPGDSIEFIATATNRTSQRVQIGIACGPSMDVIIAGPTGGERLGWAEWLGANGAFTCELNEQHFVDAGKTRIVRIPWRARSETGTYQVRAGLRRSNGLGNISKPISVVVTRSVGSPTPPPNAIVAEGAIDANLRQTVIVAPSNLTKGDTVRIRSMIRNVGTQSVTLESRICGLNIETTMSLPWPPGIGMCGGYSQTRTMAPGDSVESSELRQVQSGPGEYQVRVTHALKPAGSLQLKLTIK
jgi:hypothetical protein